MQPAAGRAQTADGSRFPDSPSGSRLHLMTCCFSRRSLEVRRLPGGPATKRICGYIPGLPSAAGLRKLAGQAFTGNRRSPRSAHPSGPRRQPGAALMQTSKIWPAAVTRRAAATAWRLVHAMAAAATCYLADTACGRHVPPLRIGAWGRGQRVPPRTSGSRYRICYRLPARINYWPEELHDGLCPELGGGCVDCAGWLV